MVTKQIVKNQFGEQSNLINVADGVPLDKFQTIVFTGAGVPTDGVTGVNAAGPGSLYIDRSGKKAYINGGTLSSPAWKIITSA